MHYIYNNFFQDLACWDLFHNLEAQNIMQDTLGIMMRITVFHKANSEYQLSIE